MSARARSGVPAASRALGAFAALLAAMAFAAPGSHAMEPGGAAPHPHAATWGSLGLIGGSTFIDTHLADYAWDTRPRAAWGAIATLGRGPFELGARAWRSSTVQRMELPSGTASPAVRSTTLEMIARARVATVFGTRVCVDGSAGGLRIDYRPGHLSVSTGVGAPVDVRLEPLGVRIAGAGVSLQHALARRWAVGVAVDRQFYGLDTAHRSGAGIVYQRESFGDWSARFEIARLFALSNRKGARP